MTPDPSRLVAALQRCHLIFFLIRVFATLHPGEPMLRMLWYLPALCYALEEAAMGKCNRLVISMPPRYLKSITATVAFPAWLLGRNPAMKIMVATYSDRLSREHSEACRLVMESDWYRKLFPTTRISARANRQLDFETTKGGGRRAISVTGSTTGFGADIIILDDCMKADEIESEAARIKVNRWFSGTLITRLNNKVEGTIISINQRLGEEDLTSRLLDLGYPHLVLKAIAEEDAVIPIGFGRVYHRRIGEVLDPDREGIAELDTQRRSMGPVAFSAQYQQTPILPEGNMIRIERLHRYDGIIERSHCQYIAQSWDTGMSDDPTSDWSVCTTWGFRENYWYLLDVYRARLTYPRLRDTIRRLNDEWQADRVIIEDAGNGKALWQEYKSKTTFRPRMWKPDGSKEERMRGQLGQIEDGAVLFPREAPWLDAYLHELRAFPGRHDDQVDSTSQFLQFAMQRDVWIREAVDPRTGRRLHVRRYDRRRKS